MFYTADEVVVLYPELAVWLSHGRTVVFTHEGKRLYVFPYATLWVVVEY